MRRNSVLAGLRDEKFEGIQEEHRCSYPHSPELYWPRSQSIILVNTLLRCYAFFKLFFRIEIEKGVAIKETHIKEFMKNLNAFRNSEMFCDFTLIVKDEVRIPVHRVVMMACSEYIRTLLTYETRDDKVDSARLPDLTSTGVQAVVAFAYTGELEMYEDTVLEVLAAASFLQVVGVVHIVR